MHAHKRSATVLFLLASLAAWPALAQSAPPPFAEGVDRVQALVDRGEAADDEQSPALYREAMALAEGLVAAYPDSARSHYSYALSAGNLALYVGGKDKVRLGREIKDSLDRALTLDPGLVDAYRVRGVYFYELATLSRLLRIFARILYGGLPRGTLEDAAADFEQAIAREPHSLFAYYHLAKTRYAQKDYAEAQRLCAQVETLPDSDGQDPVTRREAAELGKKVAKKIEQRRNRRG